MNNRIVAEAVIRISHMEELFDLVTVALRNVSSKISYDDIQEATETLSDYYSSGEWLHDYELDENKLLPSDLKRGVLSQDGLYELLCEVNHGKTSQNIV